MKKRTVFSLSALALLAYFLIFPSLLSKERYFSPSWALDVVKTAPAQSISKGETFHTFRVGEYFGAVSERGKLKSLDRVLYNVAFNDELSVNFSSVSKNLVFKDTEGTIILNLETEGYPILSKDRIVIITTDRRGLSEWDLKGNLLWEKYYSSIITCLDISEEFCLSGLLDGRISLINKKGQEVYTFAPGGSRLQVILGCAVSADARHLAVVSGIEPQRFLFFERGKDEEYKPLYNHELATDFRRRTFVSFSKNDSTVFMEGKDGLLFYDISAKKMGMQPLKGTIRTVKTDEQGVQFFVLTEEGGLSRLYSYVFPETKILEVSFPAKRSVLYEEKGYLLLGIDETLVRLDTMEG